MDSAFLLTAAEFEKLKTLSNQRDHGDVDGLFRSEIDDLLANAWHRELGVERYMVLRLTGPRGHTVAMQVRYFEGWASADCPFVMLAGPKLGRNGAIGRAKYSHEMFAGTRIERRLLDGTWRSLGVFTGRIQA